MNAAEKAKEVSAQVRAFRLPRWAELPDIELYMDQVIVLMGKYLSEPGAGGEKLLTPSMVNNYVKMGLVPAPVKKKYSRVHLSHLLIICTLKQVVPIPIVRELIASSLEQLSEEQLLDTFCDYYDVAAAQALESLAQRVELIEFEGEVGTRLLAASCAIRSQLELNLAAKLTGAEGKEKKGTGEKGKR